MTVFDFLLEHTTKEMEEGDRVVDLSTGEETGEGEE